MALKRVVPECGRLLFISVWTVSVVMNNAEITKLVGCRFNFFLNLNFEKCGTGLFSQY